MTVLESMASALLALRRGSAVTIYMWRICQRSGHALAPPSVAHRISGECSASTVASISFSPRKLVVVLFGLGIEARIVIGIPGLRASRARIDRLVQTAQAPRTGGPGPGV